MKAFESDEEEAEHLGAKQKEQRQRANLSFQQLRSTLEQLDPDGEDVQPGGANLLTAAAEEDKAAWSHKTQSEAVNQLKSLLLKQGREISSSLPLPERRSPSKRAQQEARPSLPAFQDLIPMNYDQSGYIQHLEAEVKFCKEELQELKQRIRVVVVENEKLQSELKSKGCEDSVISSKTETNTWKNDLEQLKVIHQAQIESLEAQLVSLRKDLSVSQKECEEVKVRLRHKEKQVAGASKADGAPCVAGLCVQCAQHEAVLAGTHADLHVQAIDRLTKERDELLAALRAVRASQQEAQQREWSACLQVKQAVEMAEEANLQKTRVEVQCEQLSRELARRREQLDREAHVLQAKMTEAREEGRAEARKQKEELAQMASGLSQRVAELEGQLERAHRDKNSLTNQLEDALSKLSNWEQDNTKVSIDLRYQLSNASLKKEEAERELRELKAKTSRELEKAAQEVESLSSELVCCRQRLDAAQRVGSQWQTKALSLEEQLANAQHQLHLTRQDRESAARAHVEEMASVTISAQEREKELAAMLQETEAQHLQRVGEMENLMGSQNSLIRKLKEECCKLGAKLEEFSHHSRSELEQLALEKQHLEETVKSLRARCSEMEEQCVQHGRMHQRMKNRLQQLDRHCQSSAQQVCELLAKQSQLMQERNALSEEMQQLRVELPNPRRNEPLSA
ncbi:PREDICTED: serologically defined colon cancer antigen 8 [Cyprinodon variegatus]|uniref:SHH signaling and ciliogenesis regulator sdccag8 n=1 Tax=Cyprinodon variegatus TaxID=28743 RepID=A0A3Q2D6P7_CYPVA|nr:PREDICTED: serologically defined colon cancer antigen 8 [Cyprinodon variegatus]